MDRARTIMSNSEFNQKQQETSNLMTALQLIDAPVVAPVVVQDFLDHLRQAFNDGAESIYNFEMPVVSAATSSAPQMRQHAAYALEESRYTLGAAACVVSSEPSHSATPS
jgi:hypothetical protein